MAFWGVEVKAKKPYTLKFSDFQAPRLHLSQATLGNRKSDDRTIVRCSVAESPFVYVCSLLPGTVETCALDLFFDDDVTFSVKGSTSVHLVGYFDGVFDGNESGEDVEDDGYSEEEEEEDSDYDSMDGFLVSDEDDEDDEKDWSSEEDDTRVPNTGVTIEELPDDTEVSQKSLVRFKKITKHVEGYGSAKADDMVSTVRDQKQDISSEDEDGFRVNRKAKHSVAADVDNGKGDQKQENGSNNAANILDASAEDEDGSHVGRKRKQKEAANEPPSKRKSADVQVNTLEPKTPLPGEHKVDEDSKKASKKKKKKKKKGQDASEDLSASPSAQANGSTTSPSKQNDVKSEKFDAKDVETNKKGTVRKHPNGLEIENIKMGKPDGQQATPGKKVGVIYTGRLRSNDKVFDSNVGKKPFFFRLGVGEVIKGWDIGVKGMRVGDKRRLIIPPDMGYGSKGVPGIPPNSWLKFDVELVEVK